MTVLENPYEAGLGFCVRLNKGAFIGRQALVQAKQAGPSRKLCTVTIGDEEFIPLYGGEAVLMDGEVVGRLRSAGYGFTVRRNIAYTYLPVERTQPGSPIEVEVFGRGWWVRCRPMCYTIRKERGWWRETSDVLTTDHRPLPTRL